jgi:hypothetical protein
MLRPMRIVRVTTKEELGAALATADQVVVEGDDELLSYAVSSGSGAVTVRSGLIVGRPISAPRGHIGGGREALEREPDRMPSGTDHGLWVRPTADLVALGCPVRRSASAEATGASRPSAPFDPL